VRKNLLLAVCCLFSCVAQASAEDAQYYRLLPFSDKAAECRVNQANAGCVISEILVLKPNNEFVLCSATFQVGDRTLKFSSTTPALSCQAIECSTCDLIPPIPPTEPRLELYKARALLRSPTAEAATYWGINGQTGQLTVCAINPPFAECRTVKP
jgi:hypothetical protein